MQDYALRRQHALQLFDQAIALTTAHDLTDDTTELEAAKQRLAEGQMLVVICGEFNRGKSSLINAYLEDDLCPVDMDVTTSAITTLSYGEPESITVYVRELGADEATVEEKQLVPISIQRAEIPDYVTEQRNPDNKRRAYLVNVQLPNKHLRQDVVFVDTPGMESALYGEHTVITHQFLPNANALIFVSHALEPLTTIELEFVEKMVQNCPNILFVVTKIDANPQYRDIVESNRTKLAHVLNRSPEQIIIVPVSSRAQTDYLHSGDPEDLEYSNFETLRATLWEQFLDRQGDILLSEAQRRYEQVLDRAREPLQAELMACKDPHALALDTKEQEYMAAAERLRALKNSNQWVKTLSTGIADIRSKARQQIQIKFINLQAKLQTYILDDELQREPSRILDRIDGEVQEVMTVIWRGVGEAAAVLHQNLADSAQITMRPFETGRFDYRHPDAPELPAFTRRQNDVSRVLDSVWRAKTKAASGSAVGGVVGAIVGGLVGLLGGPPGMIAGLHLGAAAGGTLGGAVAGKWGYDEQIRNLDLTDRSQAAQKLAGPLNAYRSSCQVMCDSALATLLNTLERYMHENLADQIRQETEVVQRTLAAIQQARQLTKGQAETRIKQLTKELQEIDRLRAIMTNTAATTLAQPLVKNNQASTPQAGMVPPTNSAAANGVTAWAVIAAPGDVAGETWADAPEPNQTDALKNILEEDLEAGWEAAMQNGPTLASSANGSAPVASASLSLAVGV